MIRQLHSKRDGFTLIEILMVCVISVMFLGVGFAGFRDFSRRQEVLVARRTVLSDLNLAQKNAQTGTKPDSCNGSLEGYSFEITSTNPARYEVSAVCTNNEVLQLTKSLSTGVTINTPATNPIIFGPLNRGTNLPRNTPVSLVLTSEGHTQTISITWAGEIN